MELFDVPGCEGRLKTNAEGQVFITRSGKQCKPYLVSKGYWMIAYMYKGVRLKLYIHRIIAQLFVPNPENKPQVNHKNGLFN